MGLFSKLFALNKYNPKASNYKMNTLEDIQAIPVPTEKFEYNCDFTESIEYVLCKKATEFKRNKNLDLAIECLKKALEIAPYSPMPNTTTILNRLENYLKQARRFDEAREVENLVNESNDDNNETTYNCMLQLSSMSDLIEVPRETRICSECAKYHGRIYSRKPNSKFPQMILFTNHYNNKQCDCHLTFYPFWEGSSIPSICNEKKLVEYSNRPFEDDRTKKEKKEYDDYMKELMEATKDRRDYDWLYEHLPEVAPKSYGGYRNMKHKNSANYQKLVSIAKEHGYTI